MSTVVVLTANDMSFINPFHFSQCPISGSLRTDTSRQTSPSSFAFRDELNNLFSSSGLQAHPNATRPEDFLEPKGRGMRQGHEIVGRCAND